MCKFSIYWAGRIIRNLTVNYEQNKYKHAKKHHYFIN